MEMDRERNGEVLAVKLVDEGRQRTKGWQELGFYCPRKELLGSNDDANL